MADESDRSEMTDELIENHPKMKELIEASFKKEMADPTLKEEISVLIRSGTSENKILALEKIETCGVSFPGNFEMPIFKQLMADSDPVVKARANEVYNKKFGPYLLALAENLQGLNKIYGDAFRAMSVNAVATSAAFDLSQNIARTMRNSLTIPIQLINPDFITNCIQPQQDLVRKFALPYSMLKQVSPILNIAELVSPFAEMKYQKSTLPEALGRSESDVKKELDIIINSDGDLIFNYEGYTILYNLERFLRDIIKQKICLKDPNRVPKEILGLWTKRRTEEERNPCVFGKYDLIDFSDFTDLKMIFERGRNYQLFLDICSEDQFRAIISKLNELDPIRKKIAHSRPLTKPDFDRLKLYAEDIDRILNRAQIDDSE
jgi:hypothetical protein